MSTFIGRHPPQPNAVHRNPTLPPSTVYHHFQWTVAKTQISLKRKRKYKLWWFRSRREGYLVDLVGFGGGGAGKRRRGRGRGVSGSRLGLWVEERRRGGGGGRTAHMPFQHTLSSLTCSMKLPTRSLISKPLPVKHV